MQTGDPYQEAVRRWREGPSPDSGAAAPPPAPDLPELPEPAGGPTAPPAGSTWNEDAGGGPEAPADPYGSLTSAWRRQKREESPRRPEPTGPPRTFRDALGGIRERPGRLLPFIGPLGDAREMARVYGWSRRLERGEEIEPEAMEYLADLVSEESRPATVGYQVVRLASELPAMALEFLATSGVATAGRSGARAAGLRALGTGTRETVERVLRHQTLRDLAVTQGRTKVASRLTARLAAASAAARKQAAAVRVGGEVGAVASRTAAFGGVDLLLGGGRISASTYRAAMPDLGLTEDEAGELAVTIQGSGREFLEALPEGVLDVLIEVGSESSGAALGRLALLDRANLAAQQVASKWLKRRPNKSVQDLLEVLSRAGWDGPVEEFLEERAGDAARALTGIGSVEDVFPSLDQAAAELIAFSLPLGGAVALDTVRTRGERKRREAPAEPPGEGLAVPAQPLEQRRGADATDAVQVFGELTGIENPRLAPFETDSERATEEVAGYVGLDVGLVDGDTEGRAAGMFRPQEDLALFRKGEADPEALLWHEIEHQVKRRTSPAEWLRHRAAVDAAVPGLHEQAGAAWAHAFQRSALGRRGQVPSAELRDEEAQATTAQWLAPLLSYGVTPQGRRDLQLVLEQEPSLARRLWDSLRDVLDRVLRRPRDRGRTRREAVQSIEGLRGQVAELEGQSVRNVAEAALEILEVVEATRGVQTQVTRQDAVADQLGRVEAQPSREAFADSMADVEGALVEDYDPFPTLPRARGGRSMERAIEETLQDRLASRTPAERRKEPVTLIDYVIGAGGLDLSESGSTGSSGLYGGATRNELRGKDNAAEKEAARSRGEAADFRRRLLDGRRSGFGLWSNMPAGLVHTDGKGGASLDEMLRDLAEAGFGSLDADGVPDRDSLSLDWLLDGVEAELAGEFPIVHPDAVPLLEADAQRDRDLTLDELAREELERERESRRDLPDAPFAPRGVGSGGVRARADADREIGGRAGDAGARGELRPLAREGAPAAARGAGGDDRGGGRVDAASPVRSGGSARDQRPGPARPDGAGPDSVRDSQLTFSWTPEAREEQAVAELPGQRETLLEVLGPLAGDAWTGPAERLPADGVTNLSRAYVHEDVPAFRVQGAKVTSGRDAALLFAQLRSALVERLSWMVVGPDGVVTDSSVFSIGTIAAASVPVTARDFDGIASALEATDGQATVYIAHNHPSGDPTPSMADSRAYAQVRAEVERRGAKFVGLVLDGDRYAMTGRPLAGQTHEARLTSGAIKEVPLEGFVTLDADLGPSMQRADEPAPAITSQVDVIAAIKNVRVNPDAALVIGLNSQRRIQTAREWAHEAASPYQVREWAERNGVQSLVVVREEDSAEWVEYAFGAGRGDGTVPALTIVTVKRGEEDGAYQLVSENAPLKGLEDFDRVRRPGDAEGLREEPSMWHGSPQRFEAFDLDAAGSGEGHMIRGWGVYLTDTRELAEMYRRNLSDGVRIRGPLPKGVWRADVAKLAKLSLQATRTVDQAIEDLEARAAQHQGKEVGAVFRAAADGLRDGTIEPVHGGLYRVAPAVTPEEMLDWDAPLSAQPELVRAAFEAVPSRMRGRWKDSGAWDHVKGGNAYQDVAGALHKHHGHPSSNTEGMRQASLVLLEHGVKGIRYQESIDRLGGHVHGGAVLFDAADAEILERFAPATRFMPKVPWQTRRRAGEAGLAIRQAFQDQTVRLAYLQDAEGIQRGTARAGDLHGAIDLAKSQATALQERLTARVLELLEPFREGGEAALRDVQLLLAAKTAPDVNKWMRAKMRRSPQATLFDNIDKDNPAGISDAEAREMYARLRRKLGGARVDALVEGVREANLETLETMIDGGVLDRATAEEWHEREPYYMSLRDMEAELEGDDANPLGGGGRSVGVRGPLFRKKEGRSELAEEVLVAWLTQKHYHVEAALKNRALDLQGGVLADQFDGPALERPVRIIDARAWRRENGQADPPGGVPFFRDGNAAFLVFKDERIGEALKGLDAQGADWVLRGVGRLTQLFSRGVTARSPFFWPRNFLRDVLQAGFTVASEKGAREGARVMGRAWVLLPSIIKANLGRDVPIKAKLEEARKHGYKTTWVQRGAADLKRELTAVVEGEKGWRARARAWLKVLDGMADAFEESARLAGYELELERTGSKEQAALYAKRLTVNFDMKGDRTSSMSALFAFFNPAVQGSARLLEVLTKSPRGAKLGAGLIATGLLFEVLAYALSDDDEVTGLPKYAAVSEFERSRSIVLPFEVGGVRPRMLLPYGLASLWAAGRRMAHLSSHVAGAPLDRTMRPADLVMDTVGQVLAEWQPVDPSGGPGLAMIPTVLKPVAEIQFNTTFTGGPLMPAKSAFGRELADSERYFSTLDDRWSGMVAHHLANVLNLGGPERMPTGLDVSPESVQRVLGEVMAYMGLGISEVDRASQFVASKRPASITWTPLLRDVLTEDTTYFVSEQFYQLRAEASMMRSALAGASPAERRMVRKLDPAMAGMLEAFESAHARTANLRARMRRSERRGERRELRDQLTRVQARVVRRYLDARSKR